jgi:hypothetical protein
MLKTHIITGLKYLCKTSTNDPTRPFTYLGSGKYWKRHLKKYGSNVKTEILQICESKEDLIIKGIYYSKLYNIVNSNQFANMVEERGDGGPTMLGKRITKEQKLKQGKAISTFYQNSSPEYKEKRRATNSISHEIYRYYTPKGVFTNAYTAAIANNCSNVTIINRCKTDVDKPIMSKRYLRLGWKGKTWRQLGWYYEQLHS